MSTERVANFVAELSFDKLPPEVVLQAKKAIRDVIGVMVASHGDRAVEAARRMVTARGGKRESTLIGTGRKVPCELAAFANAAMATTLDLEDGSMGLPGHPRFHRGHPGGMVVATSLATAEREKATGKQFIEAVVAGYEIELATAWAIGESVLAGRTGTYGTAAAAAKLLGLSREEIVHTLCIAEAHCPAPTYAFIWSRTDMTKEAPAWAAMTGTSAALLARAGFRGSPTIYDLPGADKNPVESLGREWEILGIYFKPHSTCRVVHAALDGTIEIMKEKHLSAGRVSKVTVGCSRQKSLKMANYRPENIWQAQYSIPFVVGSVLADGEAGPAQIAEKRLGDSLILQYADKVMLVPDDRVEALLPGHFAASVEVETTDGRKFKTFKRYPKGEPENPMAEWELIDKFKRLTSEVMGPERTGELVNIVGEIEKLENVNYLIEKVAHFVTV